MKARLGSSSVRSLNSDALRLRKRTQLPQQSSLLRVPEHHSTHSIHTWMAPSAPHSTSSAPLRPGWRPAGQARPSVPSLAGPRARWSCQSATHRAYGMFACQRPIVLAPACLTCLLSVQAVWGVCGRRRWPGRVPSHQCLVQAALTERRVPRAAPAGLLFCTLIVFNPSACPAGAWFVCGIVWGVACYHLYTYIVTFGASTAAEVAYCTCSRYVNGHRLTGGTGTGRSGSQQANG